MCILSANYPYLQPEGWIAKGAAQRDRLNAGERRLWQPPNSHEWSRSTAAKPDVFWLGLRPDHNTGNSVLYSLQTVCGFFIKSRTVICNMGCEKGPPTYSPYPRRLESLTNCWCNYKGSTFSVILRPWVLVRPESNSRPPAWQADAQSTSVLPKF